MVRTKKAILAAAAAAVTQFSLAQFSQGATFTWDGGGGNDNLSTGANWIGDVTPAAADLAIFTGAVRTNPIVDVVTQYLGVTFDASASAFTLGGTSTLTLGASPSGAGTITNNSAVTQTFAGPVAFYAGAINAASGDLVFNNVVNVGNGGTLSANSITVTGSFSTFFNGGMSSAIQAGSTGLNKTGTGTLFVGGDNSAFAGNVFINGGAIRINNGNALGAAGVGRIETALTSGGTGLGALELDGGITVAKQVTTRARQSGTVNEVSLRNISGNNTISNVVTGSGGNQFNYESVAGNLSISSWNTSATGGARNLRLLGAGNGEMVSWTAAAGNAVSVIKDGAGTWTLRTGMAVGNATFASASVNGGTLVMEPGVGTIMVGNATIATGGTLIVQGPDRIGISATPSTIAVNNGGTFDASASTNYSLQVAQTLLGGGTVKTGGTFSVFGDNPVRIGNTAAAAAGTLTVSGNLSLSNQFATAAGGLYFDLANVTTVGGGVNDLISVSGNVAVDNTGGPIEISVNPLNASYASGTYRLMEVGSGATLNAADFTLLGFSASRQTGTITTAAGQVNLTVTGSAANLVWQGDGGSNAWDVGVSNNWLNGGTPDKFFQGDNITLNNSTANTTLNLNELAQPGTITVNNDASHNYVIQGSGTIGTGILTKSGAGALTIANVGTNALTGVITISGGTLQVGAGGADGSLGSGTIVNNANLVVDKSAALAFAQVIEGSGQLVKRGAGALALTGANTYSGATVVEAGALQYNNSSALGDVAAGTSVASGAQLFSTANTTVSELLTLAGDGPVAGDGALRAGGSTTSTFNGEVSLAGATTLKVDGGATMLIAGGLIGANTDLTLNADSGGNGVIASTLSLGTGGIAKNGAGQWTLANPNITYTGATAINAGVLQYGNGTVAGDAPLPTAPVTLTGGTIAFNNTGSYVVSANISGAGGVAVGNGGGTVTLAGNLTGFTGLLTTLNGGTNSMLLVPIATGATGVQVTDVNLTGVGQGIIRLTDSNAIANGVATLDVQASQATGTGRLEVGNSVNLNFGSIILHPKNNTSASILATDGNNTIGGPIRVNTGGTFVNIDAAAGASLTLTGLIRPAQTGEGDVPGSSRALVLGGAGDGTFSGNITNRPDAATTVGIVVYKRGTGTWRLTGTNDYIGAATNAALPANAATIVEAGRLILVGTGAFAPVFSNANANAFTDIQGGRLVFDYTGGSSVASQVLSILDAGYDLDPKFSTGLIRSTTIVSGVGLGWKDDTGISQVTVGRTYYGDSNLDGQVDITDLAALATAWQTAGVWANGDFDYSGFIDITDLAALATNWQAGVGAPLAMTFEQALASVGLGGVAVPEPATVGLVGLAGLLARRRRNR